MNLIDLINEYKPSEEARVLVREHPPLGLSGPTGSGKGTVGHYLTQTENYAPIISDTTRPPRKHHDGYEVNGVQYWFISENQAVEKLKQQAYIEAKWIHGTTMYGTSVAAYERVVDSGRVPLLEIDVQGMDDLMDGFSDFQPIFLLPPSFEIWQQRLDGRGGIGLSQKISRFKSALLELERPIKNKNYHPVINDEVVETAKIIKSGEYLNEDYRNEAILVANEMKQKINMFLAQHDSK